MYEVAKEKRGVVSRQGIDQPTQVNLGSMEGRGGEGLAIKDQPK